MGVHNNNCHVKIYTMFGFSIYLHSPKQFSKHNCHFISSFNIHTYIHYRILSFDTLISALTCNCDSNSVTPMLDDGYINDKNQLPIYSFHAGDTGSEYERGYATIGPLICYGL